MPWSETHPSWGGTKLSGSLGRRYRTHLVEVVAQGRSGNADLVAYMTLRASQTLREGRNALGLIATNTLAQGDTREVGLDQLWATGWSCFMAVKSEAWPTGAANLEYSVVCLTHEHLEIPVRLDGHLVPDIDSGLDRLGRAQGRPERLMGNAGIAYKGVDVGGMGFVLKPDIAEKLGALTENPSKVLMPFVNGEDLNNRWQAEPRRWVINFHDWSLEEAGAFPELLEHVRREVKPDRDLNNREIYRRYWWRFAEPRRGLVDAVKGMDRAFGIALVSKVALPVVIDPRWVHSHATAVFATADMGFFATLSSAPHYWWAIKYASSMRTDLRYTPSDVFETMPRPSISQRVRASGTSLHKDRLAFMVKRQIGLTKTYNLVHDPSVVDPEVNHLRALHEEVDEAVCEAYGWSDLKLRHSHFETRQGIRWTVHPEVQTELQDRLLNLNHALFAAEGAGGTQKSKGGRSLISKDLNLQYAEPGLFGDDA